MNRHGKGASVIFTALTFNMQNAEPWDGGGESHPEPDINGTIAFLRAHPADILFLQEVERGFEGGNQIHPPKNFTALKEALTGHHALFEYPDANPDELPFGLGLAIFSRFALSGAWREDLPAPDCPFEFGGRIRKPSTRLLIGARADADGNPLDLLNTHLQAFFMIGSSSDHHPAQRNHVEQRLRACPPATLLAGDLNCAPGESTLQQFVRAGFTPAQTSTPTWHRRPYVVDHLLAGPGLRMLDHEVIPTDVSDHCAVRARYELLS
jgi:endonuclease/exonuclease/phosphatase family metal-dependent hydrolase